MTHESAEEDHVAEMKWCAFPGAQLPFGAHSWQSRSKIFRPNCFLIKRLDLNSVSHRVVDFTNSALAAQHVGRTQKIQYFNNGRDL